MELKLDVMGNVIVTDALRNEIKQKAQYKSTCNGVTSYYVKYTSENHFLKLRNNIVSKGKLN